jgi:hypothetical protein
LLVLKALRDKFVRNVTRFKENLELYRQSKLLHDFLESEKQQQQQKQQKNNEPVLEVIKKAL